MTDISRDEVVDALAATLRDGLEAKRSLHVPGLGTFSVDHHPSQMEQQEDGRVTMKPPHNEIVFTPED